MWVAVVVARLLGGLCSALITLVFGLSTPTLALGTAAALMSGIAVSGLLPRVSGRSIGHIAAIAAAAPAAALPLVLPLITQQQSGPTTVGLGMAGWLIGIPVMAVLVKHASWPAPQAL